MCEYVYIPKNIEEQMKNLMPENFPKDFFIQFKYLTKQQILKTKDKHRVEQVVIEGKDGTHDVIYGRLEDAQVVLPSFVYMFSLVV